MTENPVDPKSALRPGSIESRAADIDTPISPTSAASGSAVSFGEGVYLSVGHNFYQNNGVVTPDGSGGFTTGTVPSGPSGFTLTLREGHTGGTLTDAGDLTGTNANVTNIGNYVGDVRGLSPQPTMPTGGRQDLAAVAIPGADGPNSSAIVFENSADINGTMRSAGYPGSGGPLTTEINPITGLPYDTESMMVTEGTITQDGAPRNGGVQSSSAYQTEYISGDLDQTTWTPTPTDPFNTTTVEGMSAVGGQSGSGVDLNTTLTSADTRLEGISLEDRLMGSMTYGSGTVFTNAAGNAQLDVNHTATDVGAGITPLRPDSYQGLAAVAEQAAQDNETLRDTAAGGPVTPLTDQEIADRFATQTLVTDQQGADGSTSTFNGTGLNEVSYMNQNVNVNMDMGAGTDEANYFYLDQGIDATIGENSISVTKTYDTTMTVATPIGPVSASVPATATDTLTNAERIVGTGSDDTYTLESLAGVNSLDGRDLPLRSDGTAYAENDTFQLSDAVGPVTWTFDTNPDGTPNRESGTVTDGTDTVRFENMETVVTRDGDTVDGVVQGAAIDTPEIETPDNGTGATGVTPVRAIEMLAEDEATLHASGELDPASPLGQIMATPIGARMYQNLHEAGVESVPAELHAGMSAEERASELLRAGDEATREAGLPSADEIAAEQDITPYITEIPQHVAEPEMEADYSL